MLIDDCYIVTDACMMLVDYCYIVTDACMIDSKHRISSCVHVKHYSKHTVKSDLSSCVTAIQQFICSYSACERFNIIFINVAV